MSISESILCNISENYQKAVEEYERLRKELSVCDLSISDIEHQIELKSFNAFEGFAFCKLIKRLRQDRRNIKDEMEQLEIIVHSFDYKQLKKISEAVKKTQNTQKNRKYTPRVLSFLDQRELLKII